MDFYHERDYERLTWRRKREEFDLPTTDDLYRLIIKILEDESPLTLAEIRKRIAEYYWLTDKDVYLTSEYGSTPVLSSRVNTAIRKLLEIFVIERLNKGTYSITTFGKQILKAYPKLKDEDLFDIRTRLTEEYGIRYDDNGDLQKDEVNLPYIEELPELEPYYERNEPVEEWYNLDFQEIEILYNSDLRFHKIIDTGFIKYKNGSLYISVPVWHREEGYFEWYINDNVPETRLSFQKNFRDNTIQFMGFYDGKSVSRQEFYSLCYKVYKKTPKWADTEEPGIMSVIYGFILDIDAAEDGYEALKLFLRANKVTQPALAEELGVDERTVRRTLNKETPMTLEKLVEYCIVLKLPYDISKALIDKFDLPDKDGEKYDPFDGGKHQFWHWILKFGQNMSKDEINKLAEKKGFGTILK